MSIKQVFDLLETDEIPGSWEELEILSIRIEELTRLNGEDWVRANRKSLLIQWNFALQQGIDTQ
jgi:hypothetical protein